MIDFPVMNARRETVKTVQLNEAVFGRPIRGDLLTRTVYYQLAKRRSGTASCKGRADVQGGGKKPFKQKGTGNARQGTVRAPHYRTGGVVFGPMPRSYEIKLPKKVRRLALQTALSAKREASELLLVENLDLPEIKTKLLKGLLEGLGVATSVLLVIAESDQKVELSARNLPGVSVIRTEGVNVYDLLQHRSVVMTEAAWQRLEERLA